MVNIMSTFYDPATIRRLAAEGDHFYMGAAWILDQQDAARIDTTDYDCEWTRSAATIDRERVMARRLGLPYPARLDVDPH